MTNLDDTIIHCEELAEELEKRSSIHCDSMEDTMKAEECRVRAAYHRQLAEWLKELRVYRKAKEKIERMDTNYYKHCNGLDMTECAEDFKFEVLRIINECVGREVNADEDSDNP